MRKRRLPREVFPPLGEKGIEETSCMPMYKSICQIDHMHAHVQLHSQPSDVGSYLMKLLKLNVALFYKDFYNINMDLTFGLMLNFGLLICLTKTSPTFKCM